MSVNEQDILKVLRTIQDPDLHQDIVSLGFIKNMKIDSGKVAFDIEMTTPACPVKDLFKSQATEAVKKLPGVTQVDVQMTSNVRQAPTG
jgi:ATP-binding protein involved in chromosome partitioning